VNATKSGNQQHSSVAVSSGGRMLIAWSGNGTGDNAGVFVQEYDTLNSSENAVSDSFDPNASAVRLDCLPGQDEAIRNTRIHKNVSQL
jgi:hypothetical protein